MNWEDVLSLVIAILGSALGAALEVVPWWVIAIGGFVGLVLVMRFLGIRGGGAGYSQEAATGGSRCNSCHGSGNNAFQCGYCHGSGIGKNGASCGMCNGRRFHECPMCRGTGVSS